MSGPVLLHPTSIITPTDRLQALRLVKLAGDLGREVADISRLMFMSPFPAELKETFSVLLGAGLPDIIEGWSELPEEDRRYLLTVAEVVFDRRLALHAAGARFGGQA